MNAKSLFVVLTILAVLTFSAQSLFMAKHHRSQSHMARTFAHNIAHRCMSYLHSEAEAGPEIPPQVIQDFMTFAMGDKDIMDSIMNGTPLSKASTDKIKKFFLTNKGFNDAMVQSFDKDPSFPQCYKDLKPNQKKKFINILIQQMDFGQLLGGDGDYQPTDADVENIKKAISNDKELGPNVAKCLADNIELPTMG